MRSIEELNKKYFYDRLKKSLKYFKSDQIINLVQQIYSHSNNFTGQSLGDLYPLFCSYCSVLADFEDDPDFIKSLKNSLDVLKGDFFSTLQTIKNLKINNSNEFILLPVLIKSHLFSCVVYKIGNDKYEFITINKGYRKSNHTYEGYIVSLDDIEYIMKNFTFSIQYFDINKFYSFLKNKEILSSNDSQVLSNINIDSFKDLKSRNQKVGNCFYKNSEAGFTFAWASSHPDDIKNNKTPAIPLNTLDTHNRIVDAIYEATKVVYSNDNELIEKIKYEKRIYEISKKLRKYYDDSNGNISEQKILDICDANNLEECFYLMDLETFNRYFSKLPNEDISDNLKELKDFFGKAKKIGNDVFLKMLCFPTYNPPFIIKMLCTLLFMVPFMIYYRKIEKLINDYYKLSKKFNENLPYAINEYLRFFDLRLFAVCNSFCPSYSLYFIKLLAKINKYYLPFSYLLSDLDEKNFNSKKAFELSNKVVFLYVYIVTLARIGEKKQAIAEFENMLNRSLFEEEFCQGFNCLHYVINYGRNKYLDDIISQYTDIQDTNTNKDAYKYYILACCYHYTNKLDLAKQNFVKSFKLDNRFLKYHFGYLISNKKYKEMKDLGNFLLNSDLQNNDVSWRTELIRMSICGKYDIAKHFLEFGINKKDSTGKTTMIYAAINNDYNVVKYLAKKKFDVNEKDNDGKTALIYAAINNNYDVLECLIKNNADINEKDNDGKTALDYAKEDKTQNILEKANIENIIIRTNIIGQDKTPIYDIMNKLLDNKDLKDSLRKGYIKKIDIFRKVFSKGKEYKIILRREDNKAYLRYTYKVHDGIFEIQNENKKRKILLLIIHNIKKVIKKIYRYLTNWSYKYGELLKEIKQKENVYVNHNITTPVKDKHDNKILTEGITKVIPMEIVHKNHAEILQKLP